jgi:hypothetical protein
MISTPLLLDAEKLLRDFSRRMVAYVPGADTGGAEYTDKRTCWTKSTMSALQALAREQQLKMIVTEHSAYGTLRQLNALWVQGEAIVLAIGSGWGDREELEESFYRLLILKAPQKLLLYSCAKWKEEVLEQLTAALMRYPQHIQGEQYLAVNLAALEGKVFGAGCEIPHDGSLTLQESRFLPVGGSPFNWGTSPT